MHFVWHMALFHTGEGWGWFVRVGLCEVAFVGRCGRYSHTCEGTRVDMFVSVVALHVWE